MSWVQEFWTNFSNHFSSVFRGLILDIFGHSGPFNEMHEIDPRTASEPALRLALFEPDIPQNAAAVLRTCACLDIAAEIIEPCGFIFGGSPMRRAGMDYLDYVRRSHHLDWVAFQGVYPGSRRILMTTKAADPYTSFAFNRGDIVILGRESAGVPDQVHAAVEFRLTIPMAPGMRSLNVAVSAAMVTAEALKQLDAFPRGEIIRDV